MVNENFEVMCNIIRDYPQYEYAIGDKLTQCFVEHIPRLIYLHNEDYYICDELFLFNLLHEIGHAETHVAGNARGVREFEASQWAINHCKKYGVKIDAAQKKNFENQIKFWTRAEKSLIKKRFLPQSSFYPDEKLKLNWKPMEED